MRSLPPRLAPLNVSLALQITNEWGSLQHSERGSGMTKERNKCTSTHNSICGLAQASAPPPEMNPANDNRPMYWCEMSKAGDTWLLCKEGCLAALSGESETLARLKDRLV